MIICSVMASSRIDQKSLWNCIWLEDPAMKETDVGNIFKVHYFGNENSPLFPD